MIILLAIGSLISLIASLVLGIRLLRLASRTHGVPELAMGFGFLLGGFLGLLLILVGNPLANDQLDPVIAERMFSIGLTLVSVGAACTYVFVWQTFRPRSPIARGFTLLGIAGIAVTLWPIWSLPIQQAMVTPVYYAGDAIRLAGMLWGCVEAMRYHVAMRRRLKLGLADPVVANRFLLWGIAMAAGVGTVVTSTFMTLSDLTNPDALPYFVLAVLTTASPTAQWLAFFPPRFYSGWITRRATAES